MKIFSIFFLFLFATIHLFGFDLEKELNNITHDEREKMECFFDYSIKFGQAGYVLFFQNKAVCLIGMHCDHDADSKFREGWYIFKKYIDKFPHKDFILDETIKTFPSFKALHIFLINKKCLVDCVNNHSKSFEEILGRKVDGAIFLHELEAGKHLTDLINHNDILLGILLGYGEESSKLYYKKNNSAEELDESYMIITSEINDGIEIFPVAFMGSSTSKEAERINTQYQKERKILWDIYTKKNQDSTRFFLEAFCK